MASELLSIIQGEIDARLNELHPLLAEYEQLLVAAGALLDTGEVGLSAAPALGVETPEAGEIQTPKQEKPKQEKPKQEKPKPKTKSESAKAERAPRGAAREAILAALDHGSHTVGELVVVTAMSAPNLNGNLRRLTLDGTIVKTEREGKTAYALPATA